MTTPYVPRFDAERLALDVDDARRSGRPFDVAAALDALPVVEVNRDTRPALDPEDT